MSSIQRYRELYEHEKDCNRKMLAMIASVPRERRGEARFQQAVNLAAHLAACRENWLDRMTGDGRNQAPWWEERSELDSLAARFAAIEARWTDYLAALDDDALAQEFVFPIRDGKEFRWWIEGQIIQMNGHAWYHRGQIALLVSQLGGETVDTDYLFWACPPGGRGRYGVIEPS